MRIQDGVGNVRIPFRAAANGGGDGLPGLSTQTGPFHELDVESAYGAHFVRAGSNSQFDAELLMHALFDML